MAGLVTVAKVGRPLLTRENGWRAVGRTVVPLSLYVRDTLL